MTELAAPGEASPSPARSIVGLVVANTSLVAAILIYMGWSYDNALYAPFHLDPLDLGLGPQEYALRSLSLFSPVIVVVAVLFIVVMSVRSWELDDVAGAVRSALALARRAPQSTITEAHADGDGRPSTPEPAAAPPAAAEGTDQPAAETQTVQPASVSRAAPHLTIGAGVLVTAIGLALYWLATRVSISTFLVLALLGGGPLLLTWPARSHRQGRVPYALALVIAAVCALWAGSVYAQQKGAEAAQKIIRTLPTSSDIVIYSTGRLALSGRGVTVTPLTGVPPYRYEYGGLSLLLDQSGTYYLLPNQWTPGHDYTYIVDSSDDLRIVLY